LFDNLFQYLYARTLRQLHSQVFSGYALCVLRPSMIRWPFFEAHEVKEGLILNELYD